MLKPPLELSLGEAFIHGDFDIEGDIFSAFSLFDVLAARALSSGDMVALCRDWLALPKAMMDAKPSRLPAQLSGGLHTRERDRAAIQYHYDVGNEFYALWLDRNMQYSCAYFATSAEDIDTAQQQKMEHICRKLRLKPGERLLDIGCGWGGLARYAAKRYGVRVLGVTLSERQMEYGNLEAARSGLSDCVSIKLRDYRDLAGESFDKIVSVGMFEHVGRERLPEYFAHAYRLLKPSGVFLNHGISSRPAQAPRVAEGNAACCDPRQTVDSVTGESAKREARPQSSLSRRILGAGSFVQRYVFPDGELVPVSEVNLMAERAGFEVRDVENLREHYALTLRQWVNRLEANRTAAIQASNETSYRTWRLYMSASVYAFERGRITVNQTLLSKNEMGGASDLPLTRGDLYA
jgi:cyclopropane-fatty-acyl-phospholipid synthase